MPRITSLERLRRPRGWVRIHLDGAPFCELPRAPVEEEGLTVGDEVSRASVASLRDEAQRRAAVERSVRYLAHRSRSRFEVERYLRRRGYHEDAVRAALSHCEERGYLDDREFAASWARDRIRLKPRAPVLMEIELRRKGVSRPDARAGIDRAMEDEEVSEEDLLSRAARRARRRVGSGDPDALRRRLHGYLRRRGFRSGEVRRMVDALLEAREEGEDPPPEAPDGPV